MRVQETASEGGNGGAASRDGLGVELLAVLPGVRVLDSDLELGDGARAAYVGVDAEERLVLVLHARDPGGESPALLCLDALAFVRENAAALPQHLARPELRLDLEPRIVLVVSRLNPRLARRLGALLESVEVCELRTLRSAGGAARYLVPVELSSARRLSAGGPDPQSLAASLPEGERALLQRVLERMERVDDELVVLSGADSVSWRFGDTCLARLELSPQGLHACAPPQSAGRAIEGEADVEAFLEDVLLHFARELGALQSTAPEERPVDELPLPDTPLSAGEDLGQLTAEELEAFQG